MPVEGARRLGIAGGAGTGWGVGCVESACAVVGRATGDWAVAATLLTEATNGREGIRAALARGTN